MGTRAVTGKSKREVTRATGSGRATAALNTPERRAVAALRDGSSDGKIEEGARIGDLGSLSSSTHAGGRTYTSRYRRVWLIRHGERADEADRTAFRARALADKTFRWWDPELTEEGSRQAAAAGKLLKSLLDERGATGDAGARGVDLVYASPLHRTVKTAEQVAMALDVPMTTVAGLSQCAMAMRLENLAKVEFLTHEELQAANSLVTYKGDGIRINEKFGPTVARIVCTHPGDGDIVIVTHREGIRDFLGVRKRLSYCVTAEFMFDTETMQASLVELRDVVKSMRKGRKKGKKGKKAKQGPATATHAPVPSAAAQEDEAVTVWA